jgi:hypothetical protein
MPKAKNSKQKLHFEQANEICRHWTAAGDELFGYLERLKAAGFEAFVPRKTYIESFAEGPEEVAIHRQCLVEMFKERLGQPTPIPIFDSDLQNLYFSPLLQSLRQQRDRENECTERELSTRFGAGESVWRREIDPCLRRLKQDLVSQRSAHEARLGVIADAERRALAGEAERFATANRGGFDGEARYSLFVEVMQSRCQPFGFEYDKARSRAAYPVFTKPIVDDWHLCWTIEEGRAFLFSPVEGHFRPCLHLRGRQLSGRLDRVVEAGQFLRIRFAPLEVGFSNAYHVFSNADELEQVVKAHLELYASMASIIEDGVRKALR